eukprot:114170_1
MIVVKEKEGNPKQQQTEDDALYVRISNERRKGLGGNTLTRDQLLCKTLSPISGNPRPPMTNPVVSSESSFGSEPEFDIDAIFPDFNEDNTTEHDKECQMFVEQLISHGYYIQSEKDEMNLKAHNKYKKAWKKK